MHQYTITARTWILFGIVIHASDRIHEFQDLNDRTIELTNKKDGKVNGTSKTTVSPDGNTLTFVFSDSSNTKSDPVTGKGEATRVAKCPAGANLVSGSWRTTKLDKAAENLPAQLRRAEVGTIPSLIGRQTDTEETFVYYDMNALSIGSFL